MVLQLVRREGGKCDRWCGNEREIAQIQMVLSSAIVCCLNQGKEGREESGDPGKFLVEAADSGKYYVQVEQAFVEA